MVEIDEEKEVSIDRYSFSRLNSFDSTNGCLYSWYLTYREGNRGIANAWSEFGLAYHQLIKQYLDGEIFIFEIKDRYLESIQNCLYKFPKFKHADLNETILNGVLNHINSFHFFNKYKIIEYENEHLLNYDDIPFIMIPDMVAYNEQKEFVLIDHKISSIWKKNDLQKKKRQLYTYSLAIQNKYNKLPDKFQINFFKDNQIISYDFVKKEFEETKRWIHNQVEAILKETEFIPRCLQVKEPQKDFYAIWLCNHRCDCEYRPFKKEDVE